MATQRIESGQITLRGPGGGVPMQQITPRAVDYIGFRAEAQASSSLSQIVDRMSQSAFQMAGEMAKERALTDVARTPPTPEQIELAKNGDMSQLGVTGSTFNIYDAAVRKARSFQLASAFDTEAKGEIVKIMADVELGTMTSEQAGQKINNLAKGYGQSLAKADGDAAIKLTASIGVYANTAMAEAYKAERKREKEKQTLLLESNFTSTMKLVEPAVGQGFYVDASGKEQPVEALLGVYRKNLSDSAFSAGGMNVAQSMLTRFDKEVAEAKVNAATKIALGDDYMANPVAGNLKLRAGDLGRMSGVFLSMPQDDKNKVVANFIMAVNQRESVAKADQEATKQTDIKEFIPLYSRAVALHPTSPERKRLSGQIAAIAQRNPSAVPLSVLNDLLSPPKEGDGNSLIEFNVLMGIHNGTINQPEQIYNYIGKGLTGKQGVGLLGKLMSEDRRDQGELDRGISQLAGIPVIPGQMVVIDPKGQEFKRRLKLAADAEQIKLEAAQKGEILTPRQVLGALTKQVEGQRNSEGAKQARAQLKTYEAKEWINGTTLTLSNLPTLEQKYKTDKTKLNDLKRIRTLLEQAEGN